MESSEPAEGTTYVLNITNSTKFPQTISVYQTYPDIAGLPLVLF